MNLFDRARKTIKLCKHVLEPQGKMVPQTTGNTGLSKELYGPQVKKKSLPVKLRTVVFLFFFFSFFELSFIPPDQKKKKLYIGFMYPTTKAGIRDTSGGTFERGRRASLKDRKNTIRKASRAPLIGPRGIIRIRTEGHHWNSRRAPLGRSKDIIVRAEGVIL